MKKNFISMALSAVLVLGTAAFAEDISVIVDDCEVVFDDQQPVIEEDRMLVPLRGVMEAAGADVRWYDTTKKIQVQSHDNWRIAELTVDSDIMRVSKFREDNILMADTTEVELEVPAKVVNDRTLIPLRAVNDAFIYETSWDGEAMTATVRTDREIPTEDDMGIYLTADAEDVSAGDTVNVYINVKNFDGSDGSVINGVTAGLIYDKTKLQFESATLCNGDTDLSGIGASNDEFSDDSLKAANVTVSYDECPNTDTAIYKVTFTALADDGGSVSLSKRYNSRLGYDTSLVVSKDMKGEDITPMDMYVDTTPVEIR